MTDWNDDTYAYWMGYMLSTVKDVARRTHDPSCVDALREFCEHSSLALDIDRKALGRIDSDNDDPLYLAARAAGYTSVAAHNIAGFSRKVPDA